MADSEERANSREYRLRGLEREENTEAKAAREQFQRDVAAIATTAPGKRFFHYLVFRHRRQPFQGNSNEFYNAGKRYVGEELEDTLKSVLSREAFLEIIYPKSKEE